MCEEHSMAGKGPIIETVMEETWELLTEEQKKKVAVMRIEKIMKILEMKSFGIIEQETLQKINFKENMTLFSFTQSLIK